jgi:hypothetical protein
MGSEKRQADGGEKKQEPPPPAQAKKPAPEQQSGPARKQEQAPGPGTPAKQAPAAGGPQAEKAKQTGTMQRSVGNQRTNEALGAQSAAPKAPKTPKVSSPGDSAEKEAEAVADKVTKGGPAKPRDNSGPAPGDPGATHGDPKKVTGDPPVPAAKDAQHDTVHRAVAGAGHQQPLAPSPQHNSGREPTAVFDNPGPGGPIPQPTRGILETRLGTDLRHVVVHQGSEADVAARALHARALTKGNHIWLASDSSAQDLHLMAHEVAHVLQHDGETIRRTGSTPGPDGPSTSATTPAVPETKYSGGEGKADSVAKTMSLPKVSYPAWKNHSNTTIPLKRDGVRVVPRPHTTQQEKWRKGIAKTNTKTEIDRLVKEETVQITAGVYIMEFSPSGSAPTRAKSTGKALSHQGVLIGTPDELVETAVMPNWTKAGRFHVFDVDHAQEMQVSGADDIGNYWLLDIVTNQHSGGLLGGEIRSSLRKLLGAAKKKIKTGLPGDADSAIKDTGGWTVTIDSLAGDFAKLRGDPSIFWTRGEVEGGGPAKVLKKVDTKRAKELGLSSDANGQFVTILATGDGGGKAVVRIPTDKDGKPSKKKEDLNSLDELFPFYEVTSLTLGEGTGALVGQASNKFDEDKVKKIPPIPLKRLGGETSRLWELDSRVPAQQAGFYHFKQLSPIMLTEMGLRPHVGVYARGTLLPSIDLLKGAKIDIVISGEDIAFEATFDTGQFKLPGPITITGSSLGVSCGTSGFSVFGGLYLDIGTFANGSLEGKVSATGDFGLDGRLEFDKGLFKPAELGFSYAKQGDRHDWGVTGKLGIGPEQVPGVKSALIEVAYQDGKFTAHGDADLAVPGVKQGSLDVAYSEQEGMSLGGAFQLADNIPGIKGGELKATITKKPPADGWKLSASGSAQPNIPGVDAAIKASYEDGVFLVEGDVAYAKGILSGSLHVGVTNKPMETGGKPAMGTGQAPLRAYGSGTLTAKLTPWLQGTVGATLTEKGAVELVGEIKLPDSIDLFGAKEVKKNILSVGVDIPIIGVAVMGQRVGIFATIQGSLDASAGIGPGQLRELGVKVQYNPEKENETTISGGAKLHIPAHAGLRLAVRGGVGAGIPLVSAEAGLEVGGSLGVEGAVDAAVQVNWSPAKGLVLDAEASLSAEPKFRFDVNAFAKVSVGIGWLSTDLVDKHWELAAVEYGSGLKIGVTAPVHYEQGKPFDFSLDKVKFQLPEINPKQVVSDLIHHIVS